MLFGLVFLFVMANVHEIGHTVTARLLGDGSAQFLLYQVRGQSTCLGRNLYDSSSLSATARDRIGVSAADLKQGLLWATMAYSGLLLLATRWHLGEGQGLATLPR